MTKKFKQIIHNQRVVFWILVFTLVVTLFSYSFFIQQTIVNTAERGQADKKLSSLSQEMSSLEFQYITLKSDINLETAYSFGFQSTEPQFISRRSLGQADLPGSVQ